MNREPTRLAQSNYTKLPKRWVVRQTNSLKRLKNRFSRINKVIRHKINEDLFELNLEFGRKIKLTKNHSIFVLRNDGVKSEMTNNLKVGDYVVLPSFLPENDVIKEINLSKELSSSYYKNKLIIRKIPNYIYKNKKVAGEFLNDNIDKELKRKIKIPKNISDSKNSDIKKKINVFNQILIIWINFF